MPSRYAGKDVYKRQTSPCPCIPVRRSITVRPASSSNPLPDSLSRPVVSTDVYKRQALPPHKDLYAVLVNRLSERLIASGVKVFLGTTPSVADLAELKPDALIVATGSAPVIPHFCEGIANAVTAEDILIGKAKAGQRVLVVGGGMVGSETAEYLALKGGDVTILELRPDLAADMQARARSFLLESLREHKVKALTSTELVSVGPDGHVTVKLSLIHI